MVKMSENKDLLITAKELDETKERTNGTVYAFVDGKKGFFELDKVVLVESEITVADLVNKVKLLENKIIQLEVYIQNTLEELSSYKVMD